jgi:hypothetical protein
MRLVGGERTESYRLYAIAGALLGAGPIWHYLYVNRYPLRPELLLLVGGAALLGVLIALVAHRIGGLLETLAIGVLLYLFADLQFDLDTYLRWWMLLAIGVVLAFVLQRRRATIIAITLGAFYVSSLPRGGRGGTTIAHERATPATPATPAASPATTAARPTLVHVILDEQWGIGGLELEGDTATANFLTDFYVSRGFEVYPAAYSRFNRTIESIPNLLSLGQPPRLAPVDPKRQTARAFEAIPYFELLRAQGYTIRVFQNAYIDYCVARASPVASCETQPGNSVANIGYLEGSVLSRAWFAGRYFLNITSHLYRKLHPDGEKWRRASAGGGFLALRHVREAIATGPNTGVAYFVHVLLPHRPLTLQADCGILRDPRQRIGYEQPDRLSDDEWEETIELAGQQIRCTHLAFARVLDALDESAGRQNAIVIVHGDHGGRIFQNRPTMESIRSLDDRQLAGRYSTILAVRRPGVAAGVRAEPVPVQDFVWRIARQRFVGAVPADFQHFVHVPGLDSLQSGGMRPLTRSTMPWVRRGLSASDTLLLSSDGAPLQESSSSTAGNPMNRP